MNGKSNLKMDTIRVFFSPKSGLFSQFSIKGRRGSEFLTTYFWFDISAFTTFFRFPNHILKLKTLDQSQSTTEESLLTRDITVICATLSVCVFSKWKGINVFLKHILKSKARDQSIQAKKKLFCRVILSN